MRLGARAHRDRPWRIHAIAPDFHLEDVWALPTPGGPDDFPRLAALMTTYDPSHDANPLVRALFAIRRAIGALLRWDDDAKGLGARVTALRERLPADLDGAGPAPGSLPFALLYRTDDELALEIANETVHGVMHVGWVRDGDGYRGQLAVLVKPNGLGGRLYLAAIAPFRHTIVYPSLLREIGRRWAASDAPSPGT